MKECIRCHMQVDDRAELCPYCGSTELALAQSRTNPLEIEEKRGGNVVAGVVGAFLFALIGGILFFLVYQMGYIAGICGLIIYVLANYGYHLFAKGPKETKTGLVVSVIMTVLMIFLAEYIALSYEIFTVFRDEVDITMFDAIRATPDFLTDPDIKGAVIKDLVMAYVFGLVGIIGNLVSGRKGKKKQAKAESANVEP